MRARDEIREMGAIPIVLSLAHLDVKHPLLREVLWQFVIYVQIMRKSRIHSRIEGRKTVESYMYCNVTTVGMGWGGDRDKILNTHELFF